MFLALGHGSKSYKLASTRVTLPLLFLCPERGISFQSLFFLISIPPRRERAMQDQHQHSLTWQSLCLTRLKCILLGLTCSTRLEFLQASGAHALMIESCPSEAELHLFQSSLVLLNAIYETKNVSLELFDVIYDLENVTWRAVNEAFHNKSRRLWHPGDQVQIWEGAFMDMLCSIHEINEANQSAVVEFGLPKLTHVEVSMEELEREFHVGDQVRVALGENKGRTGSIVKITNGIGTIVEGMAKDLIEVTPSAIFFHLLITLSRFEYYCCILRAIP